MTPAVYLDKAGGVLVAVGADKRTPRFTVLLDERAQVLVAFDGLLADLGLRPATGERAEDLARVAVLLHAERQRGGAGADVLLALYGELVSKVRESARGKAA